MSFLTLLSGSSGVVPVNPGPSWTLTVGGIDLSNYVHNGARFVEIASSPDGLSTFTLNGNHAAVSAGASIVLTVNGQAAWEGTVSTATVQTDSDGNPVGMMVLGAPLSAQLNTSINYISSQATDVSTLASALCSQTTVPFGSQTNIGTTGGTLSIKNVASGLSVAALLSRKHWRVQNGAVSFVGPESMTSIAQPLSGASVAGSSVVVLGGLDSATKQPLQGVFQASGSGPTYQAAHPELADHATLTSAGAALADRYGESATTTTLTLPVQTNLRAGDWFVDAGGITAHAHRVEYALTSGKFVPTVDFGFPPLPVASTDTQSARAAQHPASSVAHDFLVSGGTIASIGGLSLNLSATTFVLADASTSLNPAVVTLAANQTSLISATASGYLAAEYAGLPAPGSALPLYVITTDATDVIGYENVAPHGGIGNLHLKPANPSNNPSVTPGTITIVAEGAASAKATVPFTISGLGLDDTIGSIEIVQSFAGANKWGNPHTLAWSPGSLSFTDERHGLAAQQGYDIGVNILGRDGKPLNANPLLIGTSPTISASAIDVAILAYTTAVENTLSQAAGTDGSYVNNSVVGRRHILFDTSAGGGGNMIYNPKFMGGDGTTASLSGWGTFSFGVAASWYGSNYNNGSAVGHYAGGSVLGTNLLQQLLGGNGASGGIGNNVNANETYTFSAYITTQYSGRGWLQVQDGTTGAQYNSAIVPVNTGGQFVSVTFTTGSSTSQVYVKFCMDNNNTTNSAYVYFYDPQLETGRFATTFNANYHTGLHAKVFDGLANVRNSTALNQNIPNSSAFFTDFTIEYYTSGTSPNYTVAVWYDAGTSGTDAHLYLPNYTTTPGDRDINLGHTTQASPSRTLTGISTNQTIYILAYYTPGSGVTVSAQTSPFPISQVRNAVQDGGYVAAYATVGTGATFTVTGTGGGTTAGNGGRLPNTY